MGAVVDGNVGLSAHGEVVMTCWEELPAHYPHVGLDAFAVMPNHVHAILLLNAEADDDVRAGLRPALTARRRGLPEIVRAFKSFSARRVNAARGSPGVPLWHRNYYEHIIRDEAELERIREYVVNNPAKWEMDEYYTV